MPEARAESNHPGGTANSGVAVCCPYRCRRQRDGGVNAEDNDGRAWREDPGRAVHGHCILDGGAGQVPTHAGRKELAERDPSDDDDGHRSGRPCGVPDDAAETDTDDGDEADGHAPKKIAPSTPGWPRVTWRCLAAKIRWPISKATKLETSATGNANAATMAALPVSTSRLAGMAVKVERIMPEAYSAVTDRTASDPSSTAAIMTPNNEQLVASKVWCWAAVMVAHWLAWESTRTAPAPMEKTKAKMAVRHVEGRVRSFVHSALRTLLISVGCSHRQCRSGRVGRDAHISSLS